jgi:hypothetical protein
MAAGELFSLAVVNIQNRKHVSFGRWAITGVLAPCIAIFVAVFVVLPWFTDEAIASAVGNVLGTAFIVWLLLVVLVAAYRAVRSGSRIR